MFLDVAINETVDIRILKAYRDITRIVMVPGFYFIVTTLVSTIGFNLRKFDAGFSRKSNLHTHCVCPTTMYISAEDERYGNR